MHSKWRLKCWAKKPETSLECYQYSILFEHYYKTSTYQWLVCHLEKGYMRLGQIVNLKKNKKCSNLHWARVDLLQWHRIDFHNCGGFIFLCCWIFYFNSYIVYNFHTRYSCQLCTFTFRSRRNALNSRHFLWTFGLSESYYCILHVSLEQNLLMFFICVFVVFFLLSAVNDSH